MGGTLLQAAHWDEGSGALTLAFHAAAPSEFAPFTYEIAVCVPEGYSFVEASGEGLSELAGEQEGELLTVRFVPEQTGGVELSLRF